MKKSSGHIFETLWAMIMVAVVASTLTMLVLGHTSGDSHWVSSEDYETLERYAKLEAVYENLTNYYYQELDEDTLVLGAIRGMMAAVDDPYTFYYTPEEWASSMENSDGVYHGIGVLIHRNDSGYIEVLRVYEGGSAQTAGVMPGDLIVAVDGYEIHGNDDQTYNEAVNRIRGEDGTEVALTIERNGQNMVLTVVRSDVNVSYAEYTILDDIGYVSITQFTGDAAQRFEEAIDAFEKARVSGMVIDLRNNPGGLLDVVIDIADRILPEGVIVYTEDRNGKRENFYSDEDMCDIPLVVLVNGSSASASELLSAAVKCFDRGVVVGETTFGKGIVQSVVNFAQDDSAMQLTTSSYYAGDGTSIHKTGVTPDVEIALEADYIPLLPDPEVDNQLARAIEILRENS